MLAIVIALNTIVFGGNYTPVKSIDLVSKGLTAYSYTINHRNVCYRETIELEIDIDYEEAIEYGNESMEIRAIKPRRERAEIRLCQTFAETTLVPNALAEK